MSAEEPGSQTETIDLVPVNGLRLAVRRRAGVTGCAAGTARGVLLLHGWPGARSDWDQVVDRLGTDPRWSQTTLLCPDLRGYGASDGPAVGLDSDAPYAKYAPAAHVADMAGLIEHYSLDQVLIGAYDLGANVAQALARSLGSRIAGLMLCDPVHASARAQAAQIDLSAELWYQSLHLMPWAADLIAHNRATVEVYLRHFYTHWWGDGRVEEQHFQAVVDEYSKPGAFEASIGWYRSRARSRSREASAAAGAELIATPTQVLWGEQDPVTPIVLADSLGQSFSDFQLTRLGEVGHFVPLEAPAAICVALTRLADRFDW